MHDDFAPYMGPLISRKEARKLGLKRYFSGSACRNGHVSERAVNGSNCLVCLRVSARSYALGHLHNAREARNKAKNDPAFRARPKPDICEVCFRKGIIVFDHCHKSKTFRGWICTQCNMAIGLVKDDPYILRELALYIEVANSKAKLQRP